MPTLNASCLHRSIPRILELERQRATLSVISRRSVRVDSHSAAVSFIAAVVTSMCWRSILKNGSMDWTRASSKAFLRTRREHSDGNFGGEQRRGWPSHWKLLLSSQLIRQTFGIVCCFSKLIFFLRKKKLLWKRSFCLLQFSQCSWRLMFSFQKKSTHL